MHYKTSRPLLVALALLVSSLASPAARAQSAAPEVRRLRAHVEPLASAKLEGRRTGTRGAEEAAAYVAAEFKRLGLAPAGAADGGGRGYLQPFPYVAGVELGRGNHMSAASKAGPGGDSETFVLRPGEDWMPLGFGANARVQNAPAVFVGYGVTAPEQNHDDYKGADVKGRVAIALAGPPDGDNTPHGRFARAGEARFKAAAARAAGAAALVLVASQENFKDEGLARLGYDNSGGDAGLPVVVVSRASAARLLGSNPPEVKAGHAPAFSVSISTDVARKNAPAANVVGLLEGSDPKLKNEYVVIGAHYDHLGRGGPGSLAPREGDVHHGADDNASGTAALLELARVLSVDRARMRRGVVFIAFGGEEEGLLGSSYYVNHPAFPLEQTVAMLNLDMVGRLRGGALNVGGVGTAAEWRAWVARVNDGWAVDVKQGRKVAASGPAADGRKPKAETPDAQTTTAARAATADGVVLTGANGETVATAEPAARFNLRLSEDGFGPSDHSSFYAKRVPVLFFFTGSHEDYHKPTDTADRLNYEGLASVAAFVRDIVGELQSSDARPAFTLAKADSAARSAGFRVYLGTVPSYGDSTDGLKLDGVREGSPAEKAGLRAGDVIVKLAGRDVRNVYDYTQALSAMKPEQEYEVEAVREGRRQSFKITPAARR